MNDNDCPICLEVINKNDSMTILCNHKFHLSCLHILYDKNLEKIGLECPLCRGTFNFFSELLRKKICGKTLFLLQKFINYDGSLNKIVDFDEDFDYMIWVPKYYYTILLWRQILLGYNTFKIKKLLENGADINSRNNCDDNLLIWALKNRCSLHIIKILVYLGVNLNAFNSSGENGLGYAISSESCLLIIDYLASVYNINKTDEEGNNALMACVKMSKNIEVIKILLKYGADINKNDNYGNSIFIIAVINNYSIELFNKNIINYNYYAIQLLIDNGYNVTNCSKDTFILSIIKQNYMIINLLLKNKYDINNCTTEVFEHLMLNGFSDIIDVLVDNGYDINKCSKETFSKAIENGNNYAIKKITDKGYFVGNCKYNSYLNAKQKKYKFVVDVLEKKGYSEKNIDALIIKKTVLLALTSSVRQSQTNCYVSKIILSYCANFENILLGKMIEGHVFSTIFIKP